MSNAGHKTWLLGWVLAGATAACGSSDSGSAANGGNDGGADGQSATPAQACTTPVKSFTVSNAQYFHVFASDTDAVTAMRAKGVTLLDPGSALQTRGEAVTTAVFAAYQKLYPDLVKGMPGPPRVIIGDTTVFNAFGYGPMIHESDGRVTTPWVFQFNKGFFVAGITDEQIALTAAHEFSHVIMRNTNKALFKEIAYRETSAEQGKVFGEYEMGDPSLETLANDVLDLGTRVGQGVAPELNGYGTRIGSGNFQENNVPEPLYLRYIGYLHSLYAPMSVNPTQCTSAASLSSQIETLVSKHLSPDYDLDLGSDAKTMDGLTKQFQTAEAACLSNLKVSLLQIAAYTREKEVPGAKDDIDALGGDAAKVQAYLDMSKDEIDADANDPNGNIVTKIFGVSVKAQTALREVFTDATIAYAQIRVFTPEDEADETAMRIAKIAGYDGNQLMALLLPLRGADYASTCNNDLATNTEPPYGGIIEPHHADCWRAYRNKQIVTALATCSNGWPGTP